MLSRLRCNFIFFAALCWTACTFAQRPSYILTDGPWEYATYEPNTNIRVSVITNKLFHPWGIVFIPGSSTAENPMGDALVTEREGRVRLISKGVLIEAPVADLSALSMDILFDIALHPDFAANGWVYLTYMKKAPNPDGTDAYWATTALARGQFNGGRITGVADIFVADAWSINEGSDASRITFAPDGTLYMSSSHRRDLAAPQSPASHVGKILRLNDDGSAPTDNPFFGRSDASPEVYSYGHRTVMGLKPHPVTGAMWETENGPQGGDEVNILAAGKNYGWPLMTYGRDYDGTRMPGGIADFTVEPEIFWVPSITVSGIEFYTGDEFPAWKNNLFVGSMTTGRLAGTGHIERIVLNENGEMRREQLLNDLHQRIRFVRQGPDGLLYLLTDENNGAILRIEPIEAVSGSGVMRVSTVALAESVSAQPGGEQMFSPLDCANCHQKESRTIGPSYLEIATRYSRTEQNVEMLTTKIIAGSEGVWGDVPMPPHPDLDRALAKFVVTSIMELKN